MPEDQNDFSQIWDFTGERQKQDAGRYGALEKGAAGASLFLLLRNGISPGTAALTAICTAGIAAAKSRMQEKQKNFMRRLVRDFTIGAPEDIQETAQRLFAKAGLPGRPVVRIAAPDMGAEMTALENSWAVNTRCTVQAITDKDIHDTPGETLILIGEKLAGKLDRAEIAAAIAHEAGRLAAEISSGGALHGTARLALPGIAAASVLTGQWGLLLPFGAATAGSNIAQRGLKNLSEECGDRNALALYPHPRALKSALTKFLQISQEEVGMREGSGLHNFTKSLDRLWNVERTIEKRFHNIDRHYAEVRDFYQARKLKLEL